MPVPGCARAGPVRRERADRGRPRGPGAPEPDGTRDVLEVLDVEPVCPPELLATAARVAERFFASTGEVLKQRSAGPAAGRRRGAVPHHREAARCPGARAPEGRSSDRLAGGESVRVTDLPGEPASGGRPCGPSRSAASFARRLAPGSAGAASSSPTCPFDARPRSAATALGRSREAGRCSTSSMPSDGRRPPRRSAPGRGHRGRLSRLWSTAGCSFPSSRSATQDSPPDPSADPRAAIHSDRRAGAACDAIAAAIRERRYFPALLQGVTGSGKSEVYLRSIAAALEAGRGAVWLVPEIALTPVFARELRRQFGDRAAVLHSALSERERAAAWDRVRSGSARAVIGPRSAAFAPVVDPGLFVVDEEHDASYKQREAPRYDAREVAAIRAQSRGRGARLRLRHTVGRGVAGRSPRPAHAARSHGARGRPASAARDARGPAPGERDAGRKGRATLLRGRSRCVWRRCSPAGSRRSSCSRGGDTRRSCSAASAATTSGARSAASPAPSTTGGALSSATTAASESPGPSAAPIAAGPCWRRSARAPSASPSGSPSSSRACPHAILDRDTARRRGAEAVVEDVLSGKVRCLIGTQMVAKGHDFPGVTAVGVLSADTLLNFPDFRSAEKTFQLVAQVAGRAGRGDAPGTVHVQTFHPQHPAICSAAAHDLDGFAAQELEFRRAFFYPPFSELAAVLVSSPDRERAEAEAAADRRGRETRGRGAAPLRPRPRAARAPAGPLAFPDSPAGWRPPHACSRPSRRHPRAAAGRRPRRRGRRSAGSDVGVGSRPVDPVRIGIPGRIGPMNETATSRSRSSSSGGASRSCRPFRTTRPTAARSRSCARSSTASRREIYAALTPWQKTLVARHPLRPYTLDYIAGLADGLRRAQRRPEVRGRSRHRGGLRDVPRPSGGRRRPPEGARHEGEDPPQLRHAAARRDSARRCASCSWPRSSAGRS